MPCSCRRARAASARSAWRSRLTTSRARRPRQADRKPLPVPISSTSSPAVELQRLQACGLPRPASSCVRHGRSAVRCRHRPGHDGLRRRRRRAAARPALPARAHRARPRDAPAVPPSFRGPWRNPSSNPWVWCGQPAILAVNSDNMSHRVCAGGREQHRCCSTAARSAGSHRDRWHHAGGHALPASIRERHRRAGTCPRRRRGGPRPSAPRCSSRTPCRACSFALEQGEELRGRHAAGRGSRVRPPRRAAAAASRRRTARAAGRPSRTAPAAANW